MFSALLARLRSRPGAPKTKAPAEILLRRDVTLNFANNTLSGDVTYTPESHELTLVNTYHGQQTHIYLSTGLWPKNYPQKDCVFIKDWAEDEGLTAELLHHGLVELVAIHNPHPGMTLCEVRVVR